MNNLYILMSIFAISVVGLSSNLVFGEETAAQAVRRFSFAVQTVINHQPSGDIIIVSHGTVISLFTAMHAKIDISTFWQKLGLPAIVRFTLPKLNLTEVVNEIDTPSSD